MHPFEQKVYNFIKENELLNKGDQVVIGLSGGADSVCLLVVLKALWPLLNLKLAAVHVNHGLRGEAADADQAYAAHLCRQLGVDCHIVRADVRTMAKAQHRSEEEVGRECRYAAFEALRKTMGDGKIAVAHHRDDLAETVLLNLMRGTGLKGLTGIPVKRGAVIRPLLGVTRAEIEHYLSDKAIAYCTDATNGETDYTRNKIRLQLMPYLKENINPKAMEHLCMTAAMAADASAFMEREAQKAAASCVKESEEGLLLDAGALGILDPALTREVIRLCIGKLAGRMKDIGMVHVEEVRGLLGKTVGKTVHLPYGLEAARTYDGILLGPVTDKQDKTLAGTLAQLPKEPGIYPLEEREIALKIEVFEPQENDQIPKNVYTKWFDYGKIGNEMVLRTRMSGDYMVLKDGSKKPLRRILMDDKIPKDKRDQLILLADGAHILWILGMERISEEVKVTQHTTQILCITMRDNK